MTGAELTWRRTGRGAGAPTRAGRCRAGSHGGLHGAAQARAGLGGCGGRGDPPGSAGHKPAAACRRRRGMAGQEHHCAGEGNGAGRYQHRMPPMPRQCADPPRADGGAVTRHLTGAWAQCPHTPPCAIEPGGVTVATRRGTKRRTRTSQAAGRGNATTPTAVHSHAGPARTRCRLSPAQQRSWDPSQSPARFRRRWGGLDSDPKWNNPTARCPGRLWKHSPPDRHLRQAATAADQRLVRRSVFRWSTSGESA
jgi:hypothetical protein